jgi:hypothetical protein
MIEEVHSLELQRATAAVREAEKAVVTQQQVAHSARFVGRDALMLGDRLGWTAAETERETAGWRRRRLEQIRVEREMASDTVRDQYVASRLKSKQINGVTEDIVTRTTVEDGRRVQAALDDIFLARRRYSDTRSLREEQEIKGS